MPSLAGDVPDSSTIGKSTADVAATSDTSSSARPESSQTSEAASTHTERPHERLTVLDDGQLNMLPPAAELLQPLPDHPPPSATEHFEHALQLRMTQLALTELIEGPEITEERWLEVFQWFATRRGPERDQSRETFCHSFPLASLRSALTSWPFSHPERTSIETAPRSLEAKPESYGPRSITSFQNDTSSMFAPGLTPPITAAHDENGAATLQNGTPKTSTEESEKEKEKDKSAGKKVQKMLKNRVHKEQRRITTIGRKIGHGVGRQRGGLNLRRTSSTPSKKSFCFASLPRNAGTDLRWCPV